MDDKKHEYLKNAEMAMEDDYGMIDGVINNGKSSILEQIERNKEFAGKHAHDIKSLKSLERERE